MAETIDWTQALVALGCEELDATVVEQTLGAVLKYYEDFDLVRDDAVVALHRRGARGGRGRGGVSEALTRHLVTFGRVLREAGLEVGPGRMEDALRGLDRVDVTRQDDVYWTLRTTLVARREDLEPFDRAFDAWFLRRAGAHAGAPRGRPALAAQGRQARAPRPARRPRGGAGRRRARQHRPQRPRGPAPQGLRGHDARRSWRRRAR